LVSAFGFQRSKEGVRQKRRSHRDPDDDEDAIGEDLAAVNERLDALTRQLERVVQSNAAPRAYWRSNRSSAERAAVRTARAPSAPVSKTQR